MPVLNFFGDLERFTTEQLYPYRYVITPLLIAALAGVLYLAYRLGAHAWIRAHPAFSAAVAVPLTVMAIAGGNYFLSPLWERSYLEEESPLSAAAGGAEEVPAATTVSSADPDPAASSDGAAQAGGQTVMSDNPMGETSAPTPSPAAFQPSVVYTGVFAGADDFHFGRGDALIVETEPGKYVLRFENFSVRNGPDLFVYLSEDPTGESIEEPLNLGVLKATDGAFNYEIPPEIDIERMKSAVVWCRQFAVLFTHAELMVQ